MIRAIALDDEPPALSIIENFCKKSDAVELLKTFTKTVEALSYLEKHDVDLIFLDIQMPAVSGIELSKKFDTDVMVVFTTAFSEYAVEGFNLNAIDYLLKPFTFKRFMQTIAKVKERYLSKKVKEEALPKYILVTADYSLQKIAFNQILYIEGLDDYIKIYLNNGKTVITRLTMKAILERLPANEFTRVHRSFIISLSKIESIRSKVITIDNKRIPIGNSYAPGFFNNLKE